MGKKSQKWVFIVLAKHGLNKTWIRAIGLSFFRDQTVEREREEEKREEEEEEEKKKRREEEGEKFKQAKVWNYEFLYEFPYNCMVSSLSQT